MRKQSALQSIKWIRHAERHRPVGGRMRDFFTETIPSALGFETETLKKRRASPLRKAMLENVPLVTAATALDEAQQLLQAAAEIEHALLVEYLYAAMSLKSSPVRKTLVNIAVQEMSHLLAVQNLLLFLGSTPYFERHDVSPNPDLDPFPFGLHGIRQKETVEQFVLAEMPILETLEANDRVIIVEIKGRLDPDSKYHRVGVLYARIYWLFQTTSAPEGDWTDVANIADIGPLPQWHIDNFPNAASSTTTQASRNERGLRLSGDEGEIWWQDYGRGGAFNTIDSRESALRTIYDIAVQGEGLASGAGESHFDLFFNLLKSFDDLPPNRVFPVPNNPSIRASEGSTEITDPIARAFCDLLNCRYQIMLISLCAALRCDRTNHSQNVLRQVLVSWAFFEMKTSIKEIAAQIVLRPCKIGGNPNDLCAGPPFDLEEVELMGSLDMLQHENYRLHARARQATGALKLLGFGVDHDIVAQIEATDSGRYPET